MAVHALTEVGVTPGRAREALWAAARLWRRLGEQRGFRALRVFRSDAEAGAVLVLTEWSGWAEADAAQASPPVAALLERARDACSYWNSRRLDPLFDVQLPRRSSPAALAQALQVGTLSPVEGARQQKDFGLRAMALPGTTGVMGGRCANDPGYYFCAVEFESETAMADFAESPTCREWSRIGSGSWWRKELEVRREPRGSRHAVRQESECLGNLSVRVESAPDGSAVTLRLSGSMDAPAAERFVRVRDAVVAQGCRELTLDLSDLIAATGESMQLLLATARRVKEAGGQFRLVDNQGRFNRILRVLQLNRALSLDPDAPPPRRRAARLDLRPRWKA